MRHPIMLHLKEDITYFQKQILSEGGIHAEGKTLVGLPEDIEEFCKNFSCNLSENITELFNDGEFEYC